jgi:hypothetical protein
MVVPATLEIPTSRRERKTRARGLLPAARYKLSPPAQAEGKALPRFGAFESGQYRADGKGTEPAGQRMLSCVYTENDDRSNRSKADRLDFEVTT